MKKTIIIVLAIVIVAVLAFLIKLKTGGATGCKINGGFWSNDYSECSWNSDQPEATKNWCERVGGKFNACASGCDHSPAGVACLAVCVPTCYFK